MAQVKALRIFPSKDDLDDQCNVCLENLEICLEITARAATPLSATGVAVFLEQRLRDYRLFLKIWMTDCRVKDHGLSKATLSRDSALGNLLSRSFHSLDSELRFIAGELTDSSSAAASLASQRSSSHGEHGEQADTPKPETESPLLAAGERLGNVLTSLVEMKPSIQMTQAIDAGIGAYADIRNLAEGYTKVDSQTTIRASDTGLATHVVPGSSEYEQCKSCQQWFSYSSMSSHSQWHAASDKLLSEGLLDADEPDVGEDISASRETRPYTDEETKKSQGKLLDTEEGTRSPQEKLLLSAATNGNAIVVNLLLKGGMVDPNCVDSTGRTPLSHAAERGHEAIVLRLLSEGAKPNCEDKSGVSPQSYAQEKGHKAVVRLLAQELEHQRRDSAPSEESARVGSHVALPARPDRRVASPMDFKAQVFTSPPKDNPSPLDRGVPKPVRRRDSSPGGPDFRTRRRHQPSLSSTTASSTLIEDTANPGDAPSPNHTLGLQQLCYSQYIGPTTCFEPSLMNLSLFDPHDESLSARGTLRQVGENDTFLMLPDSLTPGHQHIVEDVEAIEKIVAPYGRRLIDIYFGIVHPGFPIVQKTVFYEKYERSYRELPPPLLAAMYTLALNWWDQDEELSTLPRPDIRELERLARTTLADAMYRPKLSTIQAGLLFSQKPEGDQWEPTAQLVAIAQGLGLHLDCSSWEIPARERGLRGRLAWALYMQDKWGALVHGRPSYIFASNWAVQALTPSDFLDVDWDETDGEKLEIDRGRVLFTQMVQLSQILAEILETFYTLQAMQTVRNAGAQGTQLVLSLAKPIQLRLKEWFGALPAVVRMDSAYSFGTPQSNRLSNIGYLHLAYFAAEITLHRRIISSLTSPAALTTDAAASNPPTASSSPGTIHGPVGGGGGGGGAGGVDPYVQHICRSAAKARLISAMDFVNRLAPSHLRSFWYFASKANFALIGTFGSLLWATSPGREEADWYRRRLEEYRQILSINSKPGEGKGLTEFAIGVLDISKGPLMALPGKPGVSRTGSVVDVEARRWKSILMLGGGGVGAVGSETGSVVGGGGSRGVEGIDTWSWLLSTDTSGAQRPPSLTDSSGGGM